MIYGHLKKQEWSITVLVVNTTSKAGWSTNKRDAEQTDFHRLTKILPQGNNKNSG